MSFWSEKSNAQNIETIIVYDTVVVYDTVHIKKIQKAVVILDSIDNKSKLIAFFENQTATIPIDGIIMNVNLKHSKKMKKMTFLGLLALSFNQMVLAQTDFGLTLGNNFWTHTTNDSLKSNVSYGPQIGVFSSTYLTDKLLLRIDAQYSYLVGQENKNENSLPMVEHYFSTDFHQFTLPVQLVWSKKKFKPTLGLYFNYTKGAKNFNDLINNEELSLSTNHLGVLAGFSYDITSKLALNLNYLVGINVPNLNYKSKDRDYGEANTSISPRSHQVNLGISYRFNKKNVEEQEDD